MRIANYAALLALTVAACGAETPIASDKKPIGDEMAHHGPHIIRVQSENSFSETLRRLQGAVDARGFKTFAVIDHAAGAASIEQELRPTTLVIFGNPKGGTPVMQAEQAMGLELPLKMLVTENADGVVSIVYRDIVHMFKEYGVDGAAAGPLEKMSGALGAIAAEAGRE